MDAKDQVATDQHNIAPQTPTHVITGDGTGSPFDPKKLVLSQDFAAVIGVKRATRTIPVRKPNRHDWVRVHATWRLAPVAMIEMKDEGTTGQLYLLAPDIAQQVPPGEAKAMCLFGAVNRQNVFFLWPVRIAGEARRDSWSESAMEAALAAQERWVRVVANTSLGAYELYESSTNVDPQWPSDISNFEQALEVAFKDQFITTVDHPALKRLRGEL